MAAVPFEASPSLHYCHSLFLPNRTISYPGLLLELLWGLQGEGCAWGEATGRARGSYSDRPRRVLTKNSLETINLIERNGTAKLPGLAREDKGGSEILMASGMGETTQAGCHRRMWAQGLRDLGTAGGHSWGPCLTQPLLSHSASMMRSTHQILSKSLINKSRLSGSIWNPNVM